MKSYMIVYSMLLSQIEISKNTNNTHSINIEKHEQYHLQHNFSFPGIFWSNKTLFIKSVPH